MLVLVLDPESLRSELAPYLDRRQHLMEGSEDDTENEISVNRKSHSLICTTSNHTPFHPTPTHSLRPDAFLPHR